jgi:hypothetical protein
LVRIVHQHKMLRGHQTGNIFITVQPRSDRLRCRSRSLSKEAVSFGRCTPGSLLLEMYRRDSSMGPWTDIYAIGACIYATMQGYPPNDAPQRRKDRLSLALSRLRGVAIQII